MVPQLSVPVFPTCSQFAEVGESTPCSMRSLDARPGSYDLVVGTNRCEIWEVVRGDTPEPLVQVCVEQVTTVVDRRRVELSDTICPGCGFLLSARQ